MTVICHFLRNLCYGAYANAIAPSLRNCDPSDLSPENEQPTTYSGVMERLWQI